MGKNSKEHSMKKELQDKIINDFPKLFEDRGTWRKFYFETGDGWYALIYNACKELQEWSDKNNIQITLLQIKEKFGPVRIYYMITNDNGLNVAQSEIDTIVEKAEELSTQTCEKCGNMENVKRTNFGWIKYFCAECATKRAAAKDAHAFWAEE